MVEKRNIILFGVTLLIGAAVIIGESLLSSGNGGRWQSAEPALSSDLLEHENAKGKSPELEKNSDNKEYHKKIEAPGSITGEEPEVRESILKTANSDLKSGKQIKSFQLAISKLKQHKSLFSKKEYDALWARLNLLHDLVRYEYSYRMAESVEDKTFWRKKLQSVFFNIEKMLILTPPQRKWLEEIQSIDATFQNMKSEHRQNDYTTRLEHF
ncbi:MAG: hypothetical protein ACKV1O_05685 [Saprospiraceae bacterium]